MGSMLDALNGITAFASGEDENLSRYQRREFKVVKAFIEYAEKLGKSITEGYEKNPYFVLVVQDLESGEEYTFEQMLFFNKKNTTTLHSPIKSSWKNPETGKYTPSSIMYDIWHAIAESGLNKEVYANKMWYETERWVGMKFAFGMRKIVAKETKKGYILWETDQQKYKDWLSRQSYDGQTYAKLPYKQMREDYDDGSYDPENPYKGTFADPKEQEKTIDTFNKVMSSDTKNVGINPAKEEEIESALPWENEKK